MNYSTGIKRSLVVADEPCDDEDIYIGPDDLIVYEYDDDDGWTGLYDASGEPIYIVKPRIGFLEFEDE